MLGIESSWWLVLIQWLTVERCHKIYFRLIILVKAHEVVLNNPKKTLKVSEGFSKIELSLSSAFLCRQNSTHFSASLVTIRHKIICQFLDVQSLHVHVMVFTMFKITENMFYACLCSLNFSYAKMWTSGYIFKIVNLRHES